MILIIDNYDSFTYNLVQMFGKYDDNILVKRNDDITIDEIVELNPSHIVLSPGPGKPADAGICEALVQAATIAYPNISNTPILGVCLGHQAICEALGGDVTYAPELMHGKSSIINVNNDNKLFKNLPSKIKVGRYHSLIGTNLPECLHVIATANDNEVMAVKHVNYEIYGLQFHPESILTIDGDAMIQNFLDTQTLNK